MTIKTITTTGTYCDICNRQCEPVTQVNVNIQPEGWKLEIQVKLSNLDNSDKIGDICETCLGRQIIENVI